MIIYQILDGVFFSNLNFKNNETGDELILDARTSDAVAMAVRFDAPIFTTPQVLSEAGILLELEEPTPAQEDIDAVMEGDLAMVPLEGLQKLLDEAVKDEDFDAALELQKEIKRRNRKIE